MTPEERATMKEALLAAGERSAAIPYGPIVRDLHCHPYMELCLDIVAAAIRDAVKAEREACLRIIEHPNAGLEPPDGGDPTPDEMLANIAADIRERPL